MPESDNITRDLNTVILNTLLELKKLTDKDLTRQDNYMTVVSTFLSGVVSTAVDMVELTHPNSAPFLYADMEATAKAGGIRAISKTQSQNGAVTYSISNIDPHDAPTAMNYIGQALGVTLFKTIHELPLPLRSPEMLLRGIEVLLANVLHQKFTNAHDVLDSLCEHVHACLSDIEKRAN